MLRNEQTPFLIFSILASISISLPALAALENSEHSVAVIPAEGNGVCSDYSSNDFIKEMGAKISCPNSSDILEGTVDGPLSSSSTDPSKTEESAHWTYNCATKELTFSNSTIGINYIVTKASRNITWYTYGSGTWLADSKLYNQDAYDEDLNYQMASFALCYDLPSSDGSVVSTPYPDCNSDDINGWLGAIDCGLIGDGTVVTLWQPPNPDNPNDDRLFQCVCNESGSVVSEDCDPAGESGDLRPCYTKENGQFKATTLVEFDADPTVCTTVDNVRTCKWVPPLF